MSNLDDELRTIGEKVIPQNAVGFVQVGRSFLIGDNEGSLRIVQYDFDKNELIYSLKEGSDLLKDTSLGPLTQIRADPFSNNKVVCLRPDKPPIVVSDYQLGLGCREANDCMAREERPC